MDISLDPYTTIRLQPDGMHQGATLLSLIRTAGNASDSCVSVSLTTEQRQALLDQLFLQLFLSENT